MSGGRDRLFLVVLAGGLLLLLRLGLWELHADEDAGLAIGWLLSRGWRLYADVFSHHMPLDYLPSWAIASLFGPSPFLCRLFMLGLWAGSCAALYALKRGTDAAAKAAILFTLLSALWQTYWFGEMMLVESYWGWAALLVLALAEGRELSGARAAAAGAFLGLILSASPVCLPAAFLLAVRLARGRSLAGSFPGLALGFGGWLLLFGLWCLRHADLRLWHEDVIAFNAFSYAYFSGGEPGRPAALLLEAFPRAAAYFARALAWTDFEQYFEGVLRLAVLGTIAWHAWKRRFFEASWWVLFVVVLRLRVERFPHEPPIHGAAYFLCATWLLSEGVFRVWEKLSAPRRWAWAAACSGALAATLIPTALAAGWLKAAKPEARGAAWLVAAIRSGTDPEEAILALPMHPRLYLDTERVPAAPAVFYLPWQAAWPPERERLTRAFLERPPTVISLERMTIWGVPWSRYGGWIDEVLRSSYLEIQPRSEADRPEGERLYVRKDYAPEFLRRCASCRLARSL